MQIWQDLIKYSLIGSERQTAPLSAEGDLQAYIKQLYPNDAVPTGEAREQALLSAAALVSQYRTAGQQATTFNGTLPSVDDAEPLPLLSPLAVSHLQRLLNDSELKNNLPEWLALAAKFKRRVPFALIPALLELAAQNRTIRPAVTALIDKRGVWLASQHIEWQKLLVQTNDMLNDLRLWEEGNVAEREEYLRQCRSNDAATARDLLHAVWKQESATTRQTLLAVFSINLTPDDEDFLNSCLDDRSKGVRQLAMTLLAQLPDSAFSQRQKQRLNTWLHLETSGLLKKTTKLIVELPETWDKTWLADGIEEKPPHGKGEKAWWLEQALSYVPPAYWSTHWQLSADAILAILNKHEWRKTIVDSWKQALQHYPDAAWAETFLLRFDINQRELWKAIAPPQAERLATQLLTNTDTKKLANVLPILTNLQHAWSVEFSEQVINALQRYTQQKLTPSEIYACYYLTDLARYFAPECSNLFADKLQTTYEYDQITKVIDKIFYTLSFRRDMRNALML